MKKKQLLAGLLIIGSTCLGMVDNSENAKNEAFVNAARYGELSTVQRMVDEGVDINGTDKNGNTALMAAADIGYLRVAAFLLVSGAKVTPVDSKGETALIKAAESAFKLIDMLLENGADKKIKDKRGKTAYNYAEPQLKRLKP